jgi:regulatory protein
MKSSLSPELRQAIGQLERYCSLQERCLSQIQQKLKEIELSFEQKEYVVQMLQAEGYHDEERFAKAYARGKFRQLKWGKIKIAAGLRFLKVPGNLIEIALQEIDPNEYERVRVQLIEKKKVQLKEKDIFRRKLKIAYFLHAKGFETNDLPSMEGPA